MAVPKKRTTKSRRDKRRSHHHLRPVNVHLCKNCAAPKLNHNICGTCGFYKNKQVVTKNKKVTGVGNG